MHVCVCEMFLPHLQCYMVDTHHPWNPGDLVMWGNQMPRLREDAGRCAPLFSIICSVYDPSWDNADLLLRELFCPDEQDKIVEKNVESTLQARFSEICSKVNRLFFSKPQF